jgi:predicted methyltransferase
MFMLSRGLLPTRNMLLLGDDDLMALAIALAGRELGQPLVRHLAVVELSGEVLGFLRDNLAALGTKADLLQHDLRSPLAGRLAGRFDLAMTDPPYTTDGARLFLSRAVEALRPGPGQAIMFSFGAKGPGETLRLQQSVLDLGLSVQEMHRDFNEYHGAGVLGGRSNLYLLASTDQTRPVIAGDYAGPMYTADARGRDRVYLCVQCKARHVVGPAARWHTIAELKDLGCPACGGHRLRPLQLAAQQAAHS